jgi:hypothetical protein
MKTTVGIILTVSSLTRCASFIMSFSLEGIPPESLHPANDTLTIARQSTIEYTFIFTIAILLGI